MRIYLDVKHFYRKTLVEKQGEIVFVCDVGDDIG